MYEIFVEVTLQPNGTLTKEVNPLVVDLEEFGKGSIEYLNTTSNTSITIENRLEGELKEYDKDIYFKYRISINGSIGDIYTIMGQEEEVIFDGKLVETTNQYTVKRTDNYMYVYLKEDQRIIIGLNANGFGEIPVGIHYTIKKESGEKWKTTMKSEETDERTFTTTSDGNYCLIVNKRDYDNALTGLFYNSLPYMILIGMILLSIACLMHIEKRRIKM